MANHHFHPADLEKRLKAFIQSLTDDLSFEAARKQFHEHGLNFPMFLQLVNTELNVFRVRTETSIFSTSGEQSLNQIQTFSCRKREDSKGISRQRCNLPNESVFYCSTDEKSAVLEVIRDAGVPFYVSAWHKPDKVPLNLFDVPLFDNFPRTKWLANIHKQIVKKIEKLTNRHNKLGNEWYVAVKLLSKHFLRKEDDYLFTSFISHYALSAFDEENRYNAHALMYPPTQNSFNGYNLAVSLAHLSKFKFQYVFRAFHNGLDSEGNINLSIDKYGLPNDKGEIDWHSISNSIDKLKLLQVDIRVKNRMSSPSELNTPAKHQKVMELIFDDHEAQRKLITSLISMNDSFNPYKTYHHTVRLSDLGKVLLWKSPEGKLYGGEDTYLRFEQRV